MVISSHHYGNYIPVTLDDSEFTTDFLKKEREFIKFVIFLKNNPLPFFRIFDVEIKKDPHFKQGDDGTELWRVPIEDLKNLVNEINREILRRNLQKKTVGADVGP